jgi:hypothetical protein
MGSQAKIVDLPGGKEGKEGGEGGQKRSSSSSSRTRKPASETDLRSRLTIVFGRIADAADARGDSELATVVREDMDVMATGLVSLTRPFTALRTPLLLVLAIVEPVMAFSRIARLMLGRIVVRRAHREPAEPFPGGSDFN